LSPNRQWIAIKRSKGPSPPRPDAAVDFIVDGGREPGWIEVRDLNGRGLYEESSDDTDIDIAGWSTRNELAYWVSDRVHSRPPSLRLVREGAWHVRTLRTDGLDAGEGIAPRFTSGDALLVRAAATSDEKHRAAPGARRDWYLVSGRRPPIALTSGLSSSPSELMPQARGRELLGLSDGKLWRMNSPDFKPADVKSPISGHLLALFAWPHGPDDSTVILQSSLDSGERQYYKLEP
jgi:hypothetical protein